MYWSYFIRTALISGGSYYSFLLITALLFLVMPLADGQGGLYPIRNLGVQLTLLQPGRADFAHHITARPPGFENPAAPLL